MLRGQNVASLFLLGAVGCLAAPPDLYYFPPSPPCRIVMMTGNVLGSAINLKLLDISKKEQMKPEYLKINPQHTIPTLDDNGFILSESRAIQAYLADTSPNGEKFYPKDTQKRALVEEMLYFDGTRLYPNFLDTYKPMIMGKPMDEDKKNTMNDSLAMLEEYLSRRQWVSGDMMTIADLSILSTVSTLEAVGHDLSKFPKINSWMTKAKAAVPDYETANQLGLNHWKEMFEEIRKKLQ